MSKTLSQALAPASSAAIVGFDPATAGLQAATVKAALDELAGLLAAQAQAQGLSFAVYSSSNPLYIAHRGGALMYPENTLQAYRAAILAGAKCIEADVHLLSDGGLAVMHDTTVDATTTSTGTVASRTTAQWNALQIDANTWHRSNYGNALTPPLLPAVLSEFKGRALFVIEAKASGSGDDLVAALQGAAIPKYQAMVQAFSLSDLTSAVAAGYPAMYLTATDTDIAAATAAGVTWVGVSQAASNTVFTNWINAGFKVVAWTVNRRHRRDELLALGVSGFFTDDPQYLSTSNPIATTDGFSVQTWRPGMLGMDDFTTATYRGGFTAPDRWGKTTLGVGTYTTLMGHLSPVKGNPDATAFTLDFKAVFGSPSGGDTARWAGVFLGKNDKSFADGAAPTTDQQGFHFLLRADGRMQIYKRSTASAAQVAIATGAAIASGAEVRFRITCTATTVTIDRLDAAGAVVLTTNTADGDPAFRGGYVHISHNGLPADFRDIEIT